LAGQASEFGDQVSRAASDAKDYAGDTFDKAREAVSSSADQMRRAGTDAAEAARVSVASNVRNLREAAAAAGDTVSTRIGDVQDNASERAESAAGSAETLASDAMDRVRQAAADTARTSQEFLSTAGERVLGAGQRATQSMRETVEQNPLLVAGVGLVVGALIASALPKSATEESLMGDAIGTLKQRGRQAAAQGVETAKDAADEILASVARQADAEGLTPEGLARGARDVSQRLQRVAERAVTTAFDPDTQDHNRATYNQENSGGGNHG